MIKNPNFVVVGSGGGGGTIAWLLAKAGFSVVLLEQGRDIAKEEFEPPKKIQDLTDPLGFDRRPHDEFKYRVKRPDAKRRLRGDYNTFRRREKNQARPFRNGWTGSVLGGGSVIWGTWAFRALPIDFALKTMFEKLGQARELVNWGYTVEDWPVGINEIEPFYNVAEALLAVSGDSKSVVAGVKATPWYRELSKLEWFGKYFPEKDWERRMDYPCEAYPQTPVGHFVHRCMEAKNLLPVQLPTGIVKPGVTGFLTRDALARALDHGKPGEFWNQSASELWSDRARLACTMCGYCGEYLCWGGARALQEGALVPGGPKSGSHSTVLQELEDMRKAGAAVEIRCNAKVFEVLYDDRQQRATGVRYLDVTDPEKPILHKQRAESVIISCGAVQSARLLHMSGPAYGLGNRHDQLGRHATFHLFGLAAKATLNAKFQGKLHGEFGFTGNVTSFVPYLVRERESSRWLKAGTLTSAAKKNPLENLTDKAEKKYGHDLLKELDIHSRSLEIRLTADDLPMHRNRVDLDSTHVDEYGFPVARITREVGEHEARMYAAMVPELQQIFNGQKGAIEKAIISPHIADLIGDHQMGTCRMGNDPRYSVVDRYCRLHEAQNVFVIDSSFMPTGFGLNPMVTVVANALRVGTWIVEQRR